MAKLIIGIFCLALLRHFIKITSVWSITVRKTDAISFNLYAFSLDSSNASLKWLDEFTPTNWFFFYCNFRDFDYNQFLMIMVGFHIYTVLIQYSINGNSSRKVLIETPNSFPQAKDNSIVIASNVSWLLWWIQKRCGLHEQSQFFMRISKRDLDILQTVSTIKRKRQTIFIERYAASSHFETVYIW